MTKLHKELNNDRFVPNEGQRDFLCNNKSSFRCPSLCYEYSGSEENLDKTYIDLESSFSFENVKIVKNSKSVSVEEYRHLTGDFVSSSEKIQEKIDYLYAFCRNIIKLEIKKHVIPK